MKSHAGGESSERREDRRGPALESNMKQGTEDER